MKLILIFFISTLFAYADSAPSKNPDTASENVKNYLAYINAEDSAKIQEFLNKNPAVEGLELLIAEPNESVPAEKFGHSFLRFVDSDNKWYNDYAISFTVKLDEEVFSNIGTLTNKYFIQVQVKKMDQFWKDYIKTSSRPISRYLIPTTQNQREELMDIVRAKLVNPEEFGKYHLLNNNCLTIIADLFHDVGIASIDHKYIIPKNAAEMVEANLMSPYSKKFFSNFEDIHSDVQGLLGLSKEDYKNGINWPQDAADTIEEHLYPDLKEIDRDLSIKAFIATHTNLPSFVFLDLVKKFNRNNRNGISRFDQSAQFKSYPIKFYQTCDTAECADELKALEKELYPKEWKYAVTARTSNYLSRRRHFKLNSPQIKNYQLFAETDTMDFTSNNIINSKDAFCDQSIKIKFNPTTSQLESNICIKPDKRSVQGRKIFSVNFPFVLSANEVYFKNSLCGKIDFTTNIVDLNENCQLKVIKNNLSKRHELNLYIINNNREHYEN